MPDPTTRNGFRKPDPGSDTNTWGDNLNAGVFDLVDSSLDGWTEISSTGTTTLSSAQYVENEARMRVLKYTGASTGTLVIPSVEKWYIVHATQSDCIISNGGDSVTVPATSMALVFTDGTDIWIAETRTYTGDIDMNGNKVTDLGAPTEPGDAASKQYVDATAFATQVGNFPGLTGNAGKALVVNQNETTVAWAPAIQFKSTNFTCDRNTTYTVDTTSGVVIATLPSSPQDGDRVGFGDQAVLPGGFSANKLIVARNGKTILGLSEDMDVTIRNVQFALAYKASTGDWRFSP